jgi:hypothetical protein
MIVIRGRGGAALRVELVLEDMRDVETLHPLLLVPLKRQKRLNLAVIDVFPWQFLPSDKSDSAGVISFLTNR